MLFILALVLLLNQYKALNFHIEPKLCENLKNMGNIDLNFQIKQINIKLSL